MMRTHNPQMFIKTKYFKPRDTHELPRNNYETNREIKYVITSNMRKAAAEAGLPFGKKTPRSDPSELAQAMLDWLIKNDRLNYKIDAKIWDGLTPQQKKQWRYDGTLP